MRIALFVLTLMVSQISMADKLVYLTSLDWPPYASKNLPQQGASVAVASAAFEAMGYKLVVEFLPWSRAVNEAKNPSSQYMGYFPEYYSPDVAKDFTYSQPMGSGPLGFVEQANKAISWNTLSDLKGKRIGVVQDYVNTTEFDNLVASGGLRVSAVVSDSKNLRKIINNRLDMAVIDKNVMDHLFKLDKSLKGKASQAHFQDKLLEDKKLYICFKKNKMGQQMADIYNQGLKKIDVNAIMNKFLNAS
ncbi:MAG: transporter substrate-binding domain-containing protein [Bermanella sp.]